MLPSRFSDDHICILGLGYVGLTLAVAMADSGFRVHGLEVRADVIDSLAKDRPHFWEPQLAERLARVRAKGRFTFSAELSPAVRASVYILTVGTPLGEDGRARLGSVEQATRQVAEHIEDDALVVLRSTVKLRTARQVVQPILKRTGRRFELAVAPERTLEGSALTELFQLPQIIGADNSDTLARAAAIFGILTPTTIKLDSLEAAEMVKLIDNTYRDVTFGFANEVAKLCAAVGVSARDVIRAGKLGYPRTNLAWPGPVGGPCLEKDPHILIESAAVHGIDMAITRAARETNEAQPREVADRLAVRAAGLEGFAIKPRIVILGLAFKGVPATDDLRGTMARPIAAALADAFPGATVAGYDPVVSASDARVLGIEVIDDIDSAFSGSDIVVIANNHPAFRALELGAAASTMSRPGLIFDFWNMHDGADDALPQGVRYLGLGVERSTI